MLHQKNGKMSGICQVDLLHLCRAKLAKEAAQRDPRLSVVVRHSNLLDALISDLADRYYSRRDRYVKLGLSHEKYPRGDDFSGTARITIQVI